MADGVSSRKNTTANVMTVVVALLVFSARLESDAELLPALTRMDLVVFNNETKNTEVEMKINNTGKADVVTPKIVRNLLVY